MEKIFTGVFNSSSTATSLSMEKFFLCIGIAVLIGLFLAVTYMYKSKYTKSFVVTLATLPAVVCMVIMMVNGNIGAGVVVAGTFSLVRFRSVPGTAKEIGAIFLAMCSGLATGMGYVGVAVIFVLIISGVNMLYSASKIGNIKNTSRTMKITIPEDLDYTGVFDDLFRQYAQSYELLHVKTCNMGSLFKLTYNLDLKSEESEKAFIDALRCRNGNLEIVMARQVSTGEEL